MTLSIGRALDQVKLRFSSRIFTWMPSWSEERQALLNSLYLAWLADEGLPMLWACAREIFGRRGCREVKIG